jgi:hypothetical protein
MRPSTAFPAAICPQLSVERAHRHPGASLQGSQRLVSVQREMHDQPPKRRRSKHITDTSSG